MIQFIDTHAHLYAEEFKDDRHDMIMHALEQGVHKIYMPNVDHTSIDGMLELEEKYRGQCIAMMGLHPCYVTKDFERELYIVEDWLKRRKFAAVGEVGIDLYWDTSFRTQQEEAFKVQAGFAKAHKLPLVIHSRNATKETIELLQKLQDDSLTGVFHCFSGNLEEAKQVIELGFYLGIGGVVTFKNGGLDKILPEIDIRHLVLETDAPYLAPVPHRGKRNEPSYIPLVARKLAEVKKIDLEELAAVTSENALKLFPLH